MNAPWSHSAFGKRIDLLDPVIEQVDFEEIAWTLAGVYRWAGAADPDVSVALHTLICLEASPPGLKPWVLLHDAHEARIGDWTTPVQQAMHAAARRVMTGGDFATAGARAELVDAHDRVIHAAAGLPMPTPDQRAAIRHVDLVALQTERRDYLRDGMAHRWPPEIECIQPLERQFGRRWRPKQVCVAVLCRAFHDHLPALKSTNP